MTALLKYSVSPGRLVTLVPLRTMQGLVDFILFFATCFLLYRLLERWRTRRSRLPHPPGPPGLPLIGSLSAPLVMAHETYSEWSRLYGTCDHRCETYAVVDACLV